MKGIEVREIIADWLKTHGYDGLYIPGECACEIDQLVPCDDACMSCLAGKWKSCTECNEDKAECSMLAEYGDDVGGCCGPLPESSEATP